MRVVNVRTEQCTHYCGRIGSYVSDKHGMYADLGNPFALGWGVTRDQAIANFETWARSRPEVMERIRALPEDAVLGCWCKPQACHVDVIVKLWKEMHP